MASTWNQRGLLALVATFGVLHTTRYTGHVSDDAFIAFRYAERLATGEGLNWTDGVPVEGYSDLLWVLGVASGYLLGLSSIRVAQLLGVAGFVLAIGVVGWGGRSRALSGGAMVAASGGLAAWAVGGLEHTLMAGLVVALFVGLERRWRGMEALAMALTWLRADAVVAVLAVGGVRRSWRVVFAGLVAGALQLGLRLWLYNDWLPNTARAKVSLDGGRALQGVEWVAEALLHNGVLVGAALVGGWVCTQARPALWVAAVWCGYVALVGGDIFYGYRQLLPALPLFALAFGQATELREWRWAPAVVVAYGLSHLYLTPVTTLAQPGWAMEAVEPARTLRTAFAEADPLLATDAAGVLPYETGFRSVDMLGLNDRYLAHHPPNDFGGAAGIGHDLGEGAYVDGLNPDLVVFCSALGSLEPCFRSGREWVKLPGWSAYQPVFLAHRAGVAAYFVRRDGALGAVRTAERWEIPALLLSRRDRPARVHEGTLEVALYPGRVVPFDVTGWRVDHPHLRVRAGRLEATRPTTVSQVVLIRESQP